MFSLNLIQPRPQTLSIVDGFLCGKAAPTQFLDLQLFRRGFHREITKSVKIYGVGVGRPFRGTLSKHHQLPINYKCTS